MPIQRKGFTVIEVLVVVMIIGILATVAVFSLNNSRATSRDAKRVSDIQVLRTALEQCWLTNAAYPSAETQVNLGTGNALVLTSNGFELTPTGAVYLGAVPAGPKANEYYKYQSTITTGYAIRFTTELKTPYGAAGTYYAHSGGVDTDPSSK